MIWVQVPKMVTVSFGVDGRRWLQKTKFAVVTESPSTATSTAAPAATTATTSTAAVIIARSLPSTLSASASGKENATAAVPLAVVETPATEEARDLVVPLGSRVAKYIRIELEFASTWILISEVAFESGEYRQSHEFEKERVYQNTSSSAAASPLQCA